MLARKIGFAPFRVMPPVELGLHEGLSRSSARPSIPRVSVSGGIAA